MNTNANQQVSSQMQLARKIKNMTVGDLAAHAHTSISWITRLENMNCDPTIAFLKQISGALGIKFQLSI